MRFSIELYLGKKVMKVIKFIKNVDLVVPEREHGYHTHRNTEIENLIFQRVALFVVYIKVGARGVFMVV